jgi:hypothetical protein
MPVACVPRAATRAAEIMGASTEGSVLVMEPDTALPAGTITGMVIGWIPGDSTRRAQVDRLTFAAIEVHGATEQRTTVDSAGQFRLSGLQSGRDTLVVRFIGYRALRQQVRLPVHGGLRVVALLRASARSISHDVF